MRKLSTPVAYKAYIPLFLIVAVVLGLGLHFLYFSKAATSPTSRSKYTWPFAQNSIWNVPVGSSAQYVPAGLQAANAWNNKVTTDPEQIGTSPSDPIKSLNGSTAVHVPTSMSHNGSWNGCSTLLGQDNTTLYSGQPLVLSAGGNPSWSVNTGSLDIKGAGLTGCHGGSGLSGIGGSLRTGELSSVDPIHHVLKMNLYCWKYCSQTGSGYRWPAVKADSYYAGATSPYGYHGSVPAVRMGALLAVKPGEDLSWITDARVKKVAIALQDYGAYVVDDTAWDVHAFDLDEQMVTSGEWPSADTTFNSQLMQLITKLNVVDNNTATSVGGGGTPRAPLAPCFSDDTACTTLTTPTTPPSTPAATTVKVMPLGDSITDGYPDTAAHNCGVTTPYSAYQGSYRIALGQKYPAGTIQYVGSLSNGPAGMAGGNAHEGHCGWWIKNNTVTPGDDLYSHIDGWLASAKPDIILLQIGTNDITNGASDQTAATNLGLLIDKITADMPDAKLLVSTIPPLYKDPTNYNTLLKSVVSAKITAGKHVYQVDNFGAGLTYPADYQYDGGEVHPNTSGYTKIAASWASVLTSVLAGTTPSTTTTVPTAQVSQDKNLIIGKTLTASDGAQAGSEPAKANDANESTRWISTAADNVSLSADLGADYNLSKVSILWAGDTTKDYSLQISTDNVSWTTIATGATSGTSPQLVDQTSFTSTAPGRYFKIVTKDRWNTAYGNSVWELGIYGTVPPSTTPTTPSLPATPPPTASVIGDINGDGHVNTLDLSLLLTHDGQSYTSADLNHDGIVGAADLAMLLSHWTW
jgi:lysophospholipase L1-like esterase